MANRYPLILNATAGQLQELPTGDSLDLGGEDLINVGDLTITGDLTVTGTTTTISTQTLLVEDKNIELGVVETPSDALADGGGITLKGTTDKTLSWVDATDAWTSSERISIPLGSATAPSLTFTGDTNTGIFSPGADQVSITTNGTERLRINATGQVGSVSLGTAAAPVYTFTGDPNTGIFSPGADQVAISTNGTGRLSISSAGEVTTTNEKLNLITVGRGGGGISSNTAVGTSALVSNTTGGNSTANGLNALLSNTTGFSNTANGVNALRENTTGARNTCYGFEAGKDLTTGNNNTLIGNILGTAGLANTVIIGAGTTERLRIDSSGNVGIGTSSPLSALDVREANRADNTNTTNVGVYTTTTQAAGVGGTLALGGLWHASSFAPFGSIRGGKENSTSGNYSGYLAFQTILNGGVLSERMRITSTGNVGIGTTSPQELLHIFDGATATNQTIKFGNPGATPFASIKYSASGAEFLDLSCKGTTTGFGNIRFYTGATPDERARIDSSGRLLVGTSSARTNIGSNQTAIIQTESTVNGLGFFTAYNQNNAFGSVLAIAKSRGTTVGSNTIVQSGDMIGGLIFYGADGVDTAAAGSIVAFVDGTPGSNDMPGRLVFSTTADGLASPTERMRINSSGQILAGALGTAALPIISFLNDPNTGIFSPGADQVAISTNGTGRLFVAADGRVGVGVTASVSNTYGVPLLSVALNSFASAHIESHSDLAINGSYFGMMRSRGTQASPTHLQSGDLIGLITAQPLQDASSGSPYRNSSSINFVASATHSTTSLPTDIVFNTAGANSITPTERLRITSAGLFGIGTSSPSDKLHVSLGNAAGNYVTYGGTNRFNNGLNKIAIFRHGYWGGSQEVASIGVVTASSPGGSGFGFGNLVFHTGSSGNGDSGSTSTERMRITSAGRVGIGTSAPGANISAYSAVGAFINAIHASSGTFPKASAISLGSADVSYTYTTNGTTVALPGSAHIAALHSASINAPTDMAFMTTSGGTVSERMRIGSSGTITFKAYGAGTLSTSASGVISASDGRYKTKTRQLESGLDAIAALEPTYYRWNEGSPFESEYEELGFVAQEVAAVIPEASPGEDEEGKYRNYHDRAIIAMLVKGMQEQQSIITALTARVAALEAN